MPAPIVKKGQLEKRGSWRATTKDGKASPAPLTSTPRAPSTLSKEAKKIFRVLAPQLVAAGLLSSIDINALSRYSSLVVAWKKAMKNVEIEPNRGNIFALAKLDELVRRLEKSLGLTPADRMGIDVDPPKSDSPKGRFFESRAS
jgi:phage terminase small subunit